MAGVRLLVGIGIFVFATASRPDLVYTQPPNQWVPGVKRHGRQVGHSPPPSAEVKKKCWYTFTSSFVFMAWCLIKHG